MNPSVYPVFVIQVFTPKLHKKEKCHRKVSQERRLDAPAHAAIEDRTGVNDNGGIYITDCVFYLCRHPLIRYTNLRMDGEQAVDADPVFSENTYAQYQYGWLAEWNNELLVPNTTSVRDVLAIRRHRI